MPIVDANKVTEPSELETDLCVVGTGPAGITIATELDGTSSSVCLVESGGYRVDEETQSLYDLQSLGHPVRENFMSRARYYGGTSNIWPGRCMVLNEVDFRKRSWVAGSGWPIPYTELFRWYGKAAATLRLPELRGFDADFWREGPSDGVGSFFQNTQLQPNVALWAKRPLRFGAAYRSQIKKSRNIRLYLNSNVTEIELTPDGSAVERLHVACTNGRRSVIRPRAVVLACGGLENARLLLVSRALDQRGVGNEFDLVGRYYMDHPRAVFGRVRLNKGVDLTRLLGVPVPQGKMQLGVALSAAVQEREGLLNNYLTLETQYSDRSEKAYHSLIQTAKKVLRKGYAGKRSGAGRRATPAIPNMIYHLAPREVLPHWLYRQYALLNRKRRRNLVVVNYCEQQPDPESRVRLCGEKDRFGKNLLALDWRVGSEEKRNVMRLQEILAEHLEQNNLGRLDNTSPEAGELTFTDASHHMGTTRMSDDPRTGVVDRNSKVHGVANLFVAGSSVFPTVGHANPTLTIVALSLRMAEHLRGQLRSPSDLPRASRPQLSGRG